MNSRLRENNNFNNNVPGPVYFNKYCLAIERSLVLKLVLAPLCSVYIHVGTNMYTCSSFSTLYLLSMFGLCLVNIYIALYLIFCFRDIHLLICPFLTCHVMYDLREMRCMFCSHLHISRKSAQNCPMSVHHL